LLIFIILIAAWFYTSFLQQLGIGLKNSNVVVKAFLMKIIQVWLVEVTTAEMIERVNEIVFNDDQSSMANSNL